MMRIKKPTESKRGRGAVPMLGAAGLSLTLAGAASAATGPQATEMLTRPVCVGHAITLREEEIADVSLATFHVFGREDAGSEKPRGRLAMGACAGGCGCGCGGCGGCWTGTNYTSPVFGYDVYGPPPAPRPHRHKRTKGR